jgi:hypothetical protein
MLSNSPVHKQYTKAQTRSFGFNRIRLECMTAFDAGRELRNKQFAEKMEMCMDIERQSHAWSCF